MVVSSIRAKVSVRPLVDDQYPLLRGAFEAKRILTSVPIAVEEADYCGNEILSFVFEFGVYRGLMPVHEVGPPIWPLYAGGYSFGPDDLWTFLGSSRKDRGRIRRYMVNLMRTGLPLPFEVKELDGAGALLSRISALSRLSREVKVSAGQQIEVSVLAAPASGAWCSHNGLLIFIPRDEVYYGDVAPRELLIPGETYLAQVLEVGDIVSASTKAVEKDPWENLMVSEGSVRRATVRGRLRDGDYRVSFYPGVTGKASAPPLLSLRNGDEVMVKVLKVNPERRFILCHVDG